MAPLLICLDGSNGVGKSTLRKKLEICLKQKGFSVNSITDLCVKNLHRRTRRPYSECRALMRESYKNCDVIIQERGMLSHCVFDHHFIKRNGRHRCCKQCDIEAHFGPVLTFSLNAPASVIRSRLHRRKGFVPIANVGRQCEAFRKVTMVHNWKSLVSIFPSSVGKHTSQIVREVNAILEADSVTVQVPSARVLVVAELDGLRELFPACELAQVQTGTSVRLTLKCRKMSDTSARHFRLRLATEVGRLTQPKLFEHSTSSTKQSVFVSDEASLGATQLSPGVYILRPPISRVVERLDKFLLQVLQSIGAVDCSLPSSLPCAIFSGENEGFPDSVAYRVSDESVSASTGSYLSHAACLPVYWLYRHKNISETQVITARVKCFRKEFEYAWPRLREYQVREFVSLGAASEVNKKIDEATSELLGLFEHLGVKIKLSDATDSFLRDPAALAYQKLTNSKIEFKYESGDVSFAVGSINRHMSHFGVKWNIEADDLPAASACIGIGLERLAYAFLITHGSSEETWPSPPK